MVWGAYLAETVSKISDSLYLQIEKVPTMFKDANGSSWSHDVAVYRGEEEMQRDFKVYGDLFR